MKKIAFFVFILFLPIAFSLLIKVDVRSICNLEIKSFLIDNTSLPRLQAEIYNSGSVPFKFRAYLNASSKFWSEEYTLAPGEIKVLNFRFIPSEENKLKIFYCANVLEKNFEANSHLNKTSDFKIVSVRSYGNYLVFEIYSNVSTYLFVLPSEYPESWIIEANGKKVKQGKSLIKVNYSPLGEENEIGVYLASKDGYYTYQKVKIEKPIGLKFFFYYLHDNFWLRFQDFF